MLDVALLALRFSMMLPSILVSGSRCSGVESWCRGDPNNCHDTVDWEQGLRWMGIHPGKA